MTAFDRFERDLPAALAELYGGPQPAYRDDIVGRTARTSQRPGWTFPERWLPMSALTERMATAPRVPWRPVVAIALLVLALLATALFIGNQPKKLPAPFGPAANGTIAYASGGDIYAGDPVTGSTRLLVGGPEADSAPGYSYDGTKVAFFRAVGSDPQGAIFVVDADGSNLVRLNPYPFQRLIWANWAPDGRLGVIHEGLMAENQLDLYDATGRGVVETVSLGAGTGNIAFRPPDGREFLFDGAVDGQRGLFVMNVDGSNRRPVILSSDPGGDDFWGGWFWSADGSRIFYSRPYATPTPAGTCCELWVMDADGGNQHAFAASPGEWSGQPVVSPDGTRVAFWNASHVSIARTDGSGTPIQTGPAITGTAGYAWSPDSSRILARPNEGSAPSSYLLDPDGGPPTTVPWRSDPNSEDWQRLAK